MNVYLASDTASAAPKIEFKSTNTNQPIIELLQICFLNFKKITKIGILLKMTVVFTFLESVSNFFNLPLIDCRNICQSFQMYDFSTSIHEFSAV